METVKLEIDQEDLRELLVRLRWLQHDIGEIMLLALELFPPEYFYDEGAVPAE